MGNLYKRGPMIDYCWEDEEGKEGGKGLVENRTNFRTATLGTHVLVYFF